MHRLISFCLGLILFLDSMTASPTGGSGMPASVSASKGPLFQWTGLVKVENAGEKRERKEKAARLGREATLSFANERLHIVTLKKAVDGKELKVAPKEFFDRYRLLGDDDQMTEAISYPDAFGMTHSQWRRSYKGLPAFDMGFHLVARDAAVLTAVGDTRTFAVDPTPSLTEQEARDKAAAALGDKGTGWEVHSSTLGIASKDFTFTGDSFRLVYRCLLTRFPGSYTVDIAANDLDGAKAGEIVHLFSNRDDADVAYEAQTKYYGLQKLIVDQFAPENYQLKNLSPFPQETSLLRKDPSSQDPDKTLTESFSDTDADSHFEPSSLGQEAANLHLNFQRANEYWTKNFGWIGVDGAGKIPATSFIYDSSKDLPSWKGSTSVQKNPTLHFLFEGYLTALDVAGHEWAHAVHYFATAGATSSFGEAAALKESLGDIFGTLLEFYTYENDGDPSTQGNWTIAEEAFGSKDFGRSMINPKVKKNAETYLAFNAFYLPTDGECTVEKDYCHVNAGVGDKWFYLLVNGTGGQTFTNDLGGQYMIENGVGLEKAAHIAFLTMLMLPADATFPMAREISLNAVQNLASSELDKDFRDAAEYEAAKASWNEVARVVKNAWHAVGVGPSADETPLLFSPQDGQVAMPWPVELKQEVTPNTTACEILVTPEYDFSQKNPNLQSEAVTPIGENGKLFCKAQFDLDADGSYIWGVRTREKGGEDKEERVYPITGGIRGFGKEMLSTWGAIVSGDVGKLKLRSWIPAAKIHYFTTDDVKVAAPIVGKPIHPWPAKLLATPPSIDGGIPSEIQGYEFQVSDKPFAADHAPLEEVVNPDNMDGAFIKFERNLRVDHDYYLRVRAVGPVVLGTPSYGAWSSDEGTLFKTSRPGVWTLKDPPDGGVVGPWGIELKWEKAAGSTDSIAVFSQSADLSLPWKGGPDQPGGAKKTIETLEAGTYYWGVVPIGPEPYKEEGQAGPTIWSFKVDKGLTKPKLIKPLNENFAYGTSPIEFRWSTIEGATDYRLQISALNGNGSLTDIVSGYESIGPGYRGEKVTGDKLTNITSGSYGYEWFVEAKGPGANNWGVTSDKGYYYVAPKPPQLLKPINGVIVTDPTDKTQLDWHSDVEPAGGYTVSFYNRDCTVLYGSTGKLSESKLVWNFSPGSHYCWQVTAYGVNGTTAKSGFGQFMSGLATEAQLQASQQDQQQAETGGGSIQTAACNAKINAGQEAQPTMINYFINVGKTKGSLDLVVNAYNVPDRLQLYCENGSSPFFQTNCGFGSFISPISFNCPTSKVKAVVHALCAQGADTIWDFTVGCAY